MRCRLHTAALFLLLVLLASRGTSPHRGRGPVHAANDDGGTDIGAAFRNSFKLLMIEHATRPVTQEKTRRELAGPFMEDYRRSVRIPTQWDDADPWFTNYIGHPIHGAAAGYLWLDAEPQAPPELSLAGERYRARGYPLDRRLQRPVRVRPAQRGVYRQRRHEARNQRLG
jgi:hypothetical protein